MTRRTLIMIVGLAAMIGLYLYDRNNSTQMVLAATVVQITEHDDAAGPDSWHVTVDLQGSTVTLAPLAARPDLAVGDTLCVARITRQGRADEYRRANAKTTCA